MVDYHWVRDNDSTFSTTFTLHEPQLAVLGSSQTQKEHLLVLKPGETVTISTRRPLWDIEGSLSTARLWELQRDLDHIFTRRAELAVSMPTPSDSTLTSTVLDSLRISLRQEADRLLDSALQLVQSFIWTSPLDKGTLIALQARQSNNRLLLPPEQYYMLYDCIDSLMRAAYTPTPLMDSLQLNIRLYMRHKALKANAASLQEQRLNAYAYCFYTPHNTSYPVLQKQHWTYLCIDQKALPKEQLRLLANQAPELNLQIMAVALMPSDPCFLYTCPPGGAALTKDSIARRELLPLLDSLRITTTPFYQLYAPAGQAIAEQIPPERVAEALRQQYQTPRRTAPVQRSAAAHTIPQSTTNTEEHTMTAALDSAN